MLSEISWTTYLAAMAAFTAGYYTMIAALYYRKELTDLMRGKSGREPGIPVDRPEHEAAQGAATGIGELEAVVEDIKGILEKAGERAGKEGLIYQISRALASYDGLHQPAYRNALKNYIVKHAKELCGVDIGEDELEEEWKRLPR